MTNKKKIFMTGAAGYIGSVLTGMLLDRGYSVTAFDRMFYGDAYLNKLKKTNPRLTVIQGDVREIDRYKTEIAGSDAVINLAALSNDPSCDLNQDATIKINYEGTVNLARLAKSLGVPRFVFASSCSVYGKGGDAVLDESSPTNPVSLYAQTMVNSEEALHSMASDSFAPVMLRQATVFGLSPRMRFDLAINVMTLHAVTKGKIFVLAGGEQWRPFVHVRDTARAFIMCTEAPTSRIYREVFNTGSNRANYQIKDLAALVKKHIPQTIIDNVPDDPDTRSYRVNFDKITKELGFKAEFSAEDGIIEVRDAIRSGRLDDINSSVFYNIRRMKELGAIPVARGGEPVAYRKLPFASGIPTFAVPPQPSTTTDGKTESIATRIAKMTCYAKPPRVTFANSVRSAAEYLIGSLPLKPGGEIVISPLAHPDIPRAIRSAGFAPVTAKLALESLTTARENVISLGLDPESVKKLVRKKTAAIVISHAGGMVDPSITLIAKIAAKNKIALIEDATVAPGACTNTKKNAGSIGAGAIISFPSFSALPAINGDNQPSIPQLSAAITNNRGAGNSKKSHDTQIRPVISGSAGLLPESAVDGCIVRALDNFEHEKSARLGIASAYDREIKPLNYIHPVTNNRIGAVNMYIVSIPFGKKLFPLSREKFIHLMQAENVDVAIPYESANLHGKTKTAVESLVALPINADLADRDAVSVIRTIDKLRKYFKGRSPLTRRNFVSSR